MKIVTGAVHACPSSLDTMTTAYLQNNVARCARRPGTELVRTDGVSSASWYRARVETTSCVPCRFSRSRRLISELVFGVGYSTFSERRYVRTIRFRFIGNNCTRNERHSLQPGANRSGVVRVWYPPPLCNIRLSVGRQISELQNNFKW